MITSIDDFAVDNIIRLSSTSQIIWIDRRHPGKPLMGFKHGREFDRTLEVQTACVDNGAVIPRSQAPYFLTFTQPTSHC